MTYVRSSNVCDLSIERLVYCDIERSVTLVERLIKAENRNYLYIYPNLILTLIKAYMVLVNVWGITSSVGVGKLFPTPLSNFTSPGIPDSIN
jgi:hypothetical protein